MLIIIILTVVIILVGYAFFNIDVGEGISGELTGFLLGAIYFLLLLFHIFIGGYLIKKIYK